MKGVKWKVFIFAMLLGSALMMTGCEKGSPVVKVITAVQGESDKQYSIIYDNKKIDKTDEFSADKGKVLELDGTFFEESSESCYAYVVDPNKGDFSDLKVTCLLIRRSRGLLMM